MISKPITLRIKLSYSQAVVLLNQLQMQLDNLNQEPKQIISEDFEDT